MTHEYENTTEAALAMLCLVSYVFMLRLPSEALPMVWGKHAPGMICMIQKKCPIIFAYYLHVGTNCVHQSYLWIEGPRLCLKLKTRKNRQHGTTLWRECWCGTSAMSRFTCPIHTFGHPYDCSPWANTWSMVHCQEYGPKWRMKECPCFLHSSRVWSTKDYGSCFMMLVSKIQKATDLTIYAVGSCIVCFWIASET